MRIGLRARAAAWLLLTLAPVLGPFIDARLGLEPPAPWPIMAAAGAVLVALSMRGAQVTGRYLAVYGKSRRGEPRRLVDAGPYACMRHPMHFFLALFPLGIGLLTGSLSGAVMGVAEWLLVLALAVLVDERDAESRFGEEYRRYRERVPAFNPRPSCLARALTSPPPRRS